MEQNRAGHRKGKIAWMIILVYVFGRMIADPFFWQNFSVYYSYLFELALIVGTWMVFREPALWKSLDRKFYPLWLFTLLTGFVVYLGTIGFGLPVPVDFTSPETLILLLIVAPLLEEGIFRMTLWNAFAQFNRRPFFLVGTTTFLFMLAHFAAYPWVPEEFRGFIIYQALYVAILGVIAGVTRLKTKSYNAPVLIHFAFNFGFFLSAQINS